MCGIVGVYGEVMKKQEDIFRDLILLDTIRGPHGTGILQVDKVANSWEYIKDGVNAYDFLSYSEEVKKLFRRYSKLLLGHNRYATTGAINEENAHPFHHGNIIGVHNGTLSHRSKLIDHQNFEVDSDNIFYSIDKIGVPRTYKSLYGAWTLVWWNDKKEKLYWIRNEDRPLCYMISKNKKTVYFSSEKGILASAIMRNQEDLEEIYRVEPHQLYSLRIDDKKEVKIHKLKLEEAPPLSKQEFSSNYWSRNYMWKKTKFKIDSIHERPHTIEYTGYSYPDNETVVIYMPKSLKKLKIDTTYEGEMSHTIWSGAGKRIIIEPQDIKEITKKEVKSCLICNKIILPEEDIGPDSDLCFGCYYEFEDAYYSYRDVPPLPQGTKIN